METDYTAKISQANFVDALRQATAESHSALESLPLSAKLVSPALTVDDYSTYLSLMGGIVTSLENDVVPMISEFVPDISSRFKSQLIASDLKQLNSAVTAQDFHFKPRSAAHAFGIFYVVEGSVLGGRYILQNVSATLGLSAESGASYFAGYGNATGAMWKKFVSELQRYAAETRQHEEIIAGAKYAFDHIYNHFDTACR